MRYFYWQISFGKTMSYIYDFQYWEDNKTNSLNGIVGDKLSYKNIEQKRYSDSFETKQLLNMLNNEE